MEHSEFLDVVVRGSCALAAAARRVGPDGSVPATPDWSMAKLVKHTGTTHRWAMAVVAGGEMVSPSDLALGLPDAEDEYPDWIEAGAREFQAVVGAADPNGGCWSWGEDHHVRFWSRRMAHETTVHCWDAQSATEGSDPIAIEVAIDGIDERLGNLQASMSFRPDGPDALRGEGETLHLHTTDGDGEWLVRFGPDGLKVSREHAKADVAVRGPASDLLLYTAGRRGLDGLEVFGDRSVLTRRDAIRNF